MIRESECIIDVGAGAHNEYPEWIRTRSGLTIHAIEPHPVLAASLRAKNPQSVIVHEMLIGDGTNKTGILHVAKPLSCSSTLPFKVENIRRWKYPPGGKLFTNDGVINGIKSCSLSQFIEQTIPKFKQLDLLNIDVQGNSEEVIRGIDDASWERIPRLSVKLHLIDWEIYQGQSSAAKVIDLIINRGYRVVKEILISRGQEKRVTFEKNENTPPTRHVKPPHLFRTVSRTARAR